MRTDRTIPFVSIALIVAICPMGLAAVQGGQAQGSAAYYGAVGDYFGVSRGEVMILVEGRISADEAAVALFLARRAGVSPDAVVALRGAGQSWVELANRYSISAADFYVPVDQATPMGALALSYERFRATPRREWRAVRLSDQEVTALVNLQFLSRHLGVAPGLIMEAFERTGSFVGALTALHQRRDDRSS